MINIFKNDFRNIEKLISYKNNILKNNLVSWTDVELQNA